MEDKQIELVVNHINSLNHKEAQELLLDALAKGPNDLRALMLMAQLYDRMNQPDNALVYAYKLIESVRTEDTYCLLGDLLYKARQLDKANQVYRTILESIPGSTRAHQGIGRVEGRASASVGIRTNPAPSPLDGADGEGPKDAGIIYTARNEQIIIRELLDLIQPKTHYLIDIGAADGIEYSNSYALYAESGWRGLSIEPRIDKAAEMLGHYRKLPQRVDVLCSWVNPLNFAPVVEALQVPQAPGFISIDIDSFDYELTASVLKVLQPELICIEINERIPPPVRYALLFEPGRIFGDMTLVGGCSLQLMHDLLHEHGYATIKFEYNNLFATPQANLPKIVAAGYADWSARELYEQGFLNKADKFSVYPHNKRFERQIHLAPEDFIREFQGTLDDLGITFKYQLDIKS